MKPSVSISGVLLGLIVLAAIGIPHNVAADDRPLTLLLRLDSEEVYVGDPILAKICLVNPTDDVLIIDGATMPDVGSGTLGVQFRQAGQENWTSFGFSHVIVEPGVIHPEPKLRMTPRQELIYFEAIAYRDERFEDDSRTVTVAAIWQPGDYEFRAIAVLGKLRLYSLPVRVKGIERPEVEAAAIDLGDEVLQTAVPLDRASLSEDDVYQCQKLQKYLGESQAGWLLKWKSAWVTWLKADDNFRPKSARDLLISMRDKEMGIRRDVLTMSLALGYLQKRQLKLARMEAESIPAASVARRLLLLRIEEGERAEAASSSQ